MPNIETDEQQEVHDILMAVWNREMNADDAFEELDPGVPSGDYPSCFYFAVGWTLAECCATLDRGEDPREMEAPTVLDRCKKAQESSRRSNRAE